MIGEDEIGLPREASVPQRETSGKIRDRIAAKLGVGEKRKQEIYLDLARSTTLSDPAYWLQTLFAAGIATLGLALNSPAVIIGAMLISPLMGPILASGLALAAGDVVLGIRAALNLTLSCILAVGFSFLLVTILPFKEITAEIAIRMHPTTLDLAVALFSGAIGSLAICKEVKGVVTSIPGVAIAVALMPPLGVVGYGLAVAAAQSANEGMHVALGGGLLFLTNLVAITFMAMIVFLVVHIDAPAVRAQVNEWHKSDRQSSIVFDLFRRLPGVSAMRGGLPARLLMILVIILILLIPLGRSFNQLKQEISEQKRENRIREVVSQTWQKEFGKQANGETRSILDQVVISEHGNKLTLLMRVVTVSPVTSSEKDQFNRALAGSLNRSPDSLVAQIIEVPTAAAALKARAAEVSKQPPPSVGQLQLAFMERVDATLTGINLPPPAQFVDYRLVSDGPKNLQVIIAYLSERDIEGDAQELIRQDVRTRLDYAEARVDLERLPVSVGELLLTPTDTVLESTNLKVLDEAANYLTRHPRIGFEIIEHPAGVDQIVDPAEPRLKLIQDYLTSRWQVSADRVSVRTDEGNERVWSTALIVKR